MVTTVEWVRLAIGLLMTAVVLVFAARRVLWLAELVRTGQPATGRTDDVGTRIWLKWSIPGLAHFFTMWAFFVLLTVYIEAYGVLFQPKFHIPLIGRWDALGFLQDFFIVAVTVGIVTFAIIRIIRDPREHGRSSATWLSCRWRPWIARR